MQQGLIKKNNLSSLISSILKQNIVFAPVKHSFGIALSEIKSAEEMDFDYLSLKIPPKGLFFTQKEEIYSYGDVSADVSTIKSPLRNSKTVIFGGSRPCDARALCHLDSVFFKDIYQDPYYISRREKTLIISKACSKPLDTCFCTSFGGSPSGKEGSDILIFEIDDYLFFETCSDSGLDFMRDLSEHFTKPGKAENKAKNDMIKIAEKKVIPIVRDNTNEKVSEKLKKIYNTAPWDTLAMRCLGCSICTYFCPTCHCFAIIDENTSSGGRRSRNWDSCMFPHFFREASGHNPKMSKGARMKQRIMHKFNYTVENFGETFCVGCGRCINNCPVNIDIREIISEIIK